eukprot:1148124-Pelagomonas_calceolata.AAC.3
MVVMVKFEKETRGGTCLASRPVDPLRCSQQRVQQLEAAQRQYADLCKLINAKVVTLHTVLLGVGGTCYTEHT